MRGGVVESARTAAEQITAKETSDEEKKEILEREKQLDEDEVEAVTGGGECACFLGGGGPGDELNKTCVCVAGGGGEYSDKAVEHGYSRARCACPAIGGGVAALPWEE